MDGDKGWVKGNDPNHAMEITTTLIAAKEVILAVENKIKRRTVWQQEKHACSKRPTSYPIYSIYMLCQWCRQDEILDNKEGRNCQTLLLTPNHDEPYTHCGRQCSVTKCN